MINTGLHGFSLSFVPIPRSPEPTHILSFFICQMGLLQPPLHMAFSDPAYSNGPSEVIQKLFYKLDVSVWYLV